MTRPLTPRRATSAAATTLADLELVATALGDPTSPIVRRPVDLRWSYERQIALPMTGFNPTCGAIFVGQASAIGSWLADPHADARRLNERDRLVKEVLFAVHDYLHGWAYRALARLAPQLGIGQQPLTDATLETHAFVHLLTEAAAVVGLDYWYLATFDLEARLGIGTKTRSLTVSYAVADEDEYRRFQPGFTAQRPAFFAELARFYCTGEFEGFDVDDVRRSPRLLDWLSHEVDYGASQRRYTRLWLAHLSSTRGWPDPRTLSRPVACDEPWQRELAEALGAELWALVVRGQRRAPDPELGATWCSNPDRPLDFRFRTPAGLDLDRLAHEHADGLMPLASAAHLFDQWLAGFVYAGFDPALRALVPELRRKADLKLALTLFGGQPRLDGADDAPRDLFLLG